MKRKKNLISKLLALAIVLFFSLSTALAQPGIVDIIIRKSHKGLDEVKLLSVPVEQHKMTSLVLIHDSGEKFVKTIHLRNRFAKIRFCLPKGSYQVLITDIETGLTQK